MGANFSPTLNGYSGQGSFKFWCQTVLPIVYDDALSYYELLNKVVNYLNNTISDVSNCETNIEKLKIAFDELQNYVNEYLDDDAIPEEIDKKLDEIVSNGTLAGLLLSNEYIYKPKWIAGKYTIDTSNIIKPTPSSDSIIGKAYGFKKVSNITVSVEIPCTVEVYQVSPSQGSDNMYVLNSYLHDFESAGSYNIHFETSTATIASCVKPNSNTPNNMITVDDGNKIIFKYNRNVMEDVLSSTYGQAAMSTAVAPYVTEQIDDVVAQQIDDVVAEQIDAPVATATTTWLNANVNPVGSAVTVDSSLLVGGSASDSAVVGDFVQSTTPFMPLIFHTVRNGHNVMRVWDGSGTSTLVDQITPAQGYLVRPEYGSGSGSKGFLCKFDTNYVGFPEVDSNNKFKIGVYVKLINETRTTVKIRMSSTINAWGGNVTYVADNVIVDKSGYYEFELTLHPYENEHLVCCGLQDSDNVKLISFFPMSVGNVTNPLISNTLKNANTVPDSRTVGELIQHKTPFGAIPFCTTRAGATNNVYVFYGDGTRGYETWDCTTKLQNKPARSGSSTRGFLAKCDPEWFIDLDNINTPRELGVWVDIDGTNAPIQIRFSNTPTAWGGGGNVVSGTCNITIPKSGYYPISPTWDIPSDAPDKVIKYFGLQASDRVKYISFFPISAPNIDFTNYYTKSETDNEIRNKLFQYGDYDAIFWGDSLTAGAGGNGVNYPAVCCQELGITSYYNAGVGGETANTIALRAGGNHLVIPAGNVNGTYRLDQMVDVFGGNVAPLRQGATSEMYYFNGADFVMTISQQSPTDTNATYTISDYDGEPTLVPIIATPVNAMKTGKITVIFIGQNGAYVNGITNYDARIAIINSIINKLNDDAMYKSNMYIVMGLSSGNDNTREQDDIAYLKAFGDKFFNTRKELSSKGMAIMGLTPTSGDVAAMAAGSVPPSLISSGVHLNANGYTALGKLLANYIKGLCYNFWLN